MNNIKKASQTMDNNKKRANKWLALINIPIQMGALSLFSYLGNWLDENHPHPTVYYNKILIVGVAWLCTM
jgi:hypothetical protein